MTSLLLNDFLTQYGMLIALVFILVALMLFNFLGKKKEDTYKTNLRSSIVEGTKVKTYAGIYGTVIALRESKDGTIVTLKCGEDKKAATLEVHIDAIYAVDHKDEVDAPIEQNVEVADSENADEPIDEENEVVVEEVEEPKVAPKKKTTRKKTTKAKVEEKTEETEE